MLALDVTQLARTLTRSPNPGQSWTQPELLQFVTVAQKTVVRDTMWPAGRYVFNTTLGQQAYQTPEMYKVMRVYIQGQPLVRTDIDTLEGNFRYQYDQTGSGAGPAGLINLTGPPVVVTGQYTPRWTGQSAMTYPVSSSLGYPASGGPYFFGQRPVWLYEGGVLNFVPIPDGVYPCVMDCVIVPPKVTSDTQQLIVPTSGLDVMAWKVVELMSFGNREENTGSDQRNYAQSQYKEALASLNGQLRGFDNVGPNQVQVFPYRSFYNKGNRRNWGYTQEE